MTSPEWSPCREQKVGIWAFTELWDCSDADWCVSMATSAQFDLIFKIVFTPLVNLFFFSFFFLSLPFQSYPHFKRRRKPYLGILWTKASNFLSRVFVCVNVCVWVNQGEAACLIKQGRCLEDCRGHLMKVQWVWLVDGGEVITLSWFSNQLLSIWRDILSVSSWCAIHPSFPTHGSGGESPNTT